MNFNIIKMKIFEKSNEKIKKKFFKKKIIITIIKYI